MIGIALALRRRCPFALLLLAFALPAFGLDSTLSLRQYLHLSWTYRQGFSLPPVAAIAQTEDGFLWLGTSAGLFRFDGLRFSSWPAASAGELPSQEIRALCVSRDGSLWIGTSAGLVKWSSGRVRRYRNADALLEGVNAIAEDSSGRIWVGGARFAVIENEVVKPLPLEAGAAVIALLPDPPLHIWVGTNRGLCSWALDGNHHCLPQSDALPLSLAAGADGSLWIADRSSKNILSLQRGAIRFVLKRGPNLPSIRHIWRDRTGNVWMGTLGDGLLRLKQGRLEALTRADGLSSNFINTIFEDRHGNLWLGTAEGLDRLRDPAIPRISTSEGLSNELITAVCARRDGSVWLGTSGGGLNRITGSVIAAIRTGAGLPSNSIMSLFEDGTDHLWAGTTAGLVREVGTRFQPVLAADGSVLDRVFALTEAPDGEIWLLDDKRGLLKQVRDHFEAPAIGEASGLAKPYQIQFDPSGTLWLGYYQGQVVKVRDSRILWQASPGKTETTVRAICADANGNLWLGTSRGLSRLRAERWTNWTTSHGLPDGGVVAIRSDAAGGLWLVTPDRLLRASAQSLNASADGQPLGLTLSTYGLGEGIRFGANGIMANPRTSLASDGKLWIATEDGVAVVDPAQLKNRLAQPLSVLVERMSVDSRTLDMLDPADLRFRGNQLQFDYTALNLTDSERTRFRYRLGGFDHDWVDAGTRRSITYANLPAGHYTFQVSATGGDAVWSSTPAAVTFQIQQVFYKTGWFFALVSLMLLLWCWSIYAFRERRRRDRFELILAERTRVARDLHDTILQGFAGVVFQLDAAARQFDTAPAIARQKLNRAIEQADQSLEEARLALSYMRMRAVENSTLFEAISVAGRQLTDDTVAFDAILQGDSYELPIDVQANLYALAREAMTNAVNHAQASEIQFEMIYSGKLVTLRVGDNGIGFDAKMEPANRDHFGLSAMKERAEHIGAAFKIESGTGQGTTVEIVVNASRARARG